MFILVTIITYTAVRPCFPPAGSRALKTQECRGPPAGGEAVGVIDEEGAGDYVLGAQKTCGSAFKYSSK